MSIYISTYNRDRLVNECLKKLSALDHFIDGDYEVTVYNNFSTDHTHQALIDAKSYFKNPNTLQIFSQQQFQRENSGCSTGVENFLNRGRYTLYISDNDYLKIDAFLENYQIIKNSKNSISILTNQISVLDREIESLNVPDFNAISKNDANSFLQVFFDFNLLDYFKTCIGPNETKRVWCNIPSIFMKHITYLQAYKAMRYSDIQTYPHNFYCCVNNDDFKSHSHHSMNNKFYIKNDTTVLMNTILASAWVDGFNSPILDHEIEIGKKYEPNRIQMCRFEYLAGLAIQNRDFIAGAHLSRIASMYGYDGSVKTAKLYTLHLICHSFTRWLKSLFFIENICIPYLDTVETLLFLQCCELQVPGVSSCYKIQKGYEVEYTHPKTIIIVKHIFEKEKIIDGGMVYPGLVFCIEEVFEECRGKGEPFDFSLFLSYFEALKNEGMPKFG